MTKYHIHQCAMRSYIFSAHIHSIEKGTELLTFRNLEEKRKIISFCNNICGNISLDKTLHKICKSEKTRRKKNSSSNFYENLKNKHILWTVYS